MNDDELSGLNVVIWSQPVVHAESASQRSEEPVSRITLYAVAGVPRASEP